MILNSRNMKFYIIFITGCIVFANAQNDTTNSTVADTTFANTTFESTTPINTTIMESTTVITTTTEVPPSPPKVDNPKTYQWIINTTGNVCLVLKAGIQFEFTYNQSNKQVKTKMNIENGTTISDKSTCGEYNNILILKFDKNTFIMEFVNESGNAYLANAALHYFIDNTTFPGADNFDESATATDNITEFKTSIKKSYLCKSGTDFKLATNLTVHMENVQVQAFRNENNTEFSEAEECGGDSKINDIVPIAVGCALALLVIIVLIAYLVGRRRSRQQGYQSV